jgi:hypothetical protein
VTSRKAVAVRFAAALLLLAAALELAVAGGDLDMKLLRPLLYYQGADVDVHRTSADAVLHYELRPGARARFGPDRAVSINALGFRGVERTREKPKGVFRIVCIGGSNTYGVVDDAETYPAQLEKRLNAARPGRYRYEVWNAGVSAYVLSQNAEQAELLLKNDAPDLLLFQVSNCGRRPFLAGAPFDRYFQDDPRLYGENLRFPPFRFNLVHLALMRRWRAYRALIVAVNRLPRYAWPADHCADEEDGFNREAFRAFYRRRRGDVPMALLYYPGFGRGDGFDSLGMKTIVLADALPPGHGAEYELIHPPAPVYAWYARAIEKALDADGLLPRAERR